MLGCNFCGGIAGISPCQAAFLNYNAADPRLLKRVGAAQPGHSPSDDQYVRMNLTPQGREMGKLRIQPDRFHDGPPFTGYIGNEKDSK